MFNASLYTIFLWTFYKHHVHFELIIFDLFQLLTKV